MIGKGKFLKRWLVIEPARGRRSHIFPRWLPSLFSLLPVGAIILVWMVLQTQGSPCFRLGLAQNHFTVTKIDRPLNAEFLPGDHITAINQQPFHRIISLQSLIRPSHSQRTTVTIERNGHLLNYVPHSKVISTPAIFLSVWPHLLMVVSFVVLGNLTLWRTDRQQSTDLLLISYSFFVLMFISEFVFHFGLLDSRLLALAFWTTVICHWMGFSSWTHFILQFPVERQFLTGRPILVLLIYVVPPVLAISAAWLLGGKEISALSWLQRIRGWATPLLIIGCLLKHHRDYQVVASPMTRSQLKALLTLGLIGISPYLFCYHLPSLVFGRPLISFDLVMISGVIIPLGVFIIFIRYRLLDLSQLIGRGLIITILGVMFIILFIGLRGFFLSRFWDQAQLFESILFIYIFICILAFNPLNRVLQNTFERIFFRDQRHYRQQLDYFSRQVVGSLDFNKLADLLINELPDRFRMQKTGLGVLRDSSVQLFPPHPAIKPLFETQGVIIKQLTENSTPLICHTDYNDPVLAAAMGRLLTEGYVLILGLRSAGKLIGMLLLGPKKNRRFYTGTEMRLLITLGNQVTVALENAMVHQDLKQSRSEQLRLSLEMAQAEKMTAIGEMTAVLAHEIKNPLSVIRSSAEYLKGNGRSPEVQTELIGYIAEEAETLSTVVNDLLGKARFKSPIFTPLDPGLLIAKLIHRQDQSADRNPHIIIEQQNSCPGVTMHADAGQLAQLFRNLIRNSEEAMPGGGTLTIRMDRGHGDDGVVITFVDTGSGMSEVQIAEVFTKFFTTKASGVGLGLVICRQIVRSHRGQIYIENRDRGGVRVTVMLPRDPGLVIEEPAQYQTPRGDNETLTVEVDNAKKNIGD